MQELSIFMQQKHVSPQIIYKLCYTKKIFIKSLLKTNNNCINILHIGPNLLYNVKILYNNVLFFHYPLFL
jgi:hypothetical protein